MRRSKFKDSRSILALLFVCLLASMAYAADETTFHYQSEDDYDDDTVVDADDICPRESDPQQWDVDEDGIGDVCDNCAGQANPSQTDIDGDELGDACDADRDADGHYNADDLCPDVFDEAQDDLDTDSVGDACDDDIDGDGLPNLGDPCPYDAAVSSGPSCNRNSDTDNFDDFDLSGGLAVPFDNCPFLANDDQDDLDSDGLGDVCDSDVDGDGTEDSTDNCPVDANEDQADGDRDGIGDVCDGEFCYVVLGDEENCLDPLGDFVVYTPQVTGAWTGDQLRLRLFANREDVELEYSWRLTRAPQLTEIANPRGTVDESTPFEYRYATGEESYFVPLVQGTYSVEVEATEVSTGESSTAQAKFFVEGPQIAGSDDCSCRSVGIGAPGLQPSFWAALLMLICVVTVRRSTL